MKLKLPPELDRSSNRGRAIAKWLEFMKCLLSSPVARTYKQMDKIASQLTLEYIRALSEHATAYAEEQEAKRKVMQEYYAEDEDL